MSTKMQFAANNISLKGAIFFLLLSLSSCFSSLPDATPEQAVAVRTAMQSEQNYLSNQLQEFYTLLNSFTQHPGAKLLIDELYIDRDPVFPLNPVTAELLSPHYGEYQETTVGTFELVSTLPHPGIIIHYTAGIQFRFTPIGFGAQTNVLNRFDLWIASSTSVGASEAIEVNLKYDNSVGVVAGVVQGITIDGKIKYTRNDGTPVHYQVKVYTGAFDHLCHYYSPFNSTCELAEAGDYVKGQGIHFVDLLNAPSWLTEDFVLFTPSNQANVWLAKQVGKHFRRYNSDSDGNIYYDWDIKAKEGTNFSVPDTIDYYGVGQTRFSQIIEPPYSVSFAHIEGGPYTCDLNNPTAPGTGLPLTLIWVDGYSEPMLPTPGFGCSSLVWVH